HLAYASADASRRMSWTISFASSSATSSNKFGYTPTGKEHDCFANPTASAITSARLQLNSTASAPAVSARRAASRTDSPERNRVPSWSSSVNETPSGTTWPGIEPAAAPEATTAATSSASASDDIV